MAWGMLYGAACSLVIALVSGKTMNIVWTLPYLGSLLYLAVFGSVLAFAAYYTLLGRIGAGRTGYIGVMVPVIALVVSALFEGFQWQLATWLGAGLSLAEDTLAFRHRYRHRYPHRATYRQTYLAMESVRDPATGRIVCNIALRTFQSLWSWQRQPGRQGLDSRSREKAEAFIGPGFRRTVA